MDSNTNQVTLPASEMEVTFIPSDSSPRKRVRSETAEDISRNATSNHGTFAQITMDIDTNNPNQDQRQPPAASSDNSTADQSLYMQYLKDTFAAVINARVKKYGSDRVELYKRQVALRSLRNHATKNTFPKDLCFSIQTGNPYKKTNPERDTLMQQEQAILLQAKQSILQQRIKVAENEIQRYEQLCLTYHPDNNNTTIVEEFHRTFNNQIILTEEQKVELTSAYRVNFIQKQTNMDLLHAKKEELYKKHLEKQQKTTPISATLNEQQFKSSIIDMMKSFLDANNKKASLKSNSSNSSKPQRKQQAPLSNNTKKQQLPAAKKKTTYPSSSNNDKQNAKTTHGRKDDNNNNASSPSFRNTKIGNNSTFTRKPTTNQPTSMLSNNLNRDTYANKVKSQQHREVKIIHLNDDDTIDNDDGFTIVKRGKNKKQQSNQPKNVSASDPRNVPKRRN